MCLVSIPVSSTITLFPFFIFPPLLKIRKEYVILLKEVFLILSEWDYGVIDF